MENMENTTNAAQAATATSTNNASATAVATVKAKFEQAEQSALERLGLFEVWSLSGTILTPQAILPDDVSLEQATDVAKGEVHQGLYKSKTVVPVFDKEKLKSLRDIRKDAQEYLSSVGVQAEGQSSWTVLSSRHAEVAKKLEAYKNAFSAALNAILAGYEEVVESLKGSVAKIESEETRKAILARVPSKTELQGRCSLKIQSLDLYKPSEESTDAEAFAVDVANSLSALKSIEDGYWKKVTGPFSTMLGDIRRCAARGRDFSTVLGKKRGALTHAVRQALAAEGDLRIAFGMTPDAELVEDAYALLHEVQEKFCTGSRAIPKELEGLVIEAFFKVAGVFESLDNIKTYVASGDPLFEGWFDLRDPAKTLAAMRQQEAAENGTAEPDLLSGAEPAQQAEAPAKAEAEAQQQAAGESPEAVSEAEAEELDKLMAQAGAVVYEPEAEGSAAQAADPAAKAQRPAPAAPADKDVKKDNEKQEGKEPSAAGAYDANAAVTDLSALL